MGFSVLMPVLLGSVENPEAIFLWHAFRFLLSVFQEFIWASYETHEGGSLLTRRRTHHYGSHAPPYLQSLPSVGNHSD